MKTRPSDPADPLAETYTAWKAAPGPATAGAVLRAADPVIGSALAGFGGSQANSPVLRGRARRIVLDALPGYDPARGRIKTYLLGHLQGLRRAAADQTDIIAVPEQVKLDRFHLFEATGRLRDDLGREPDDTELADATGLSLRRISHIRRAASAVPEGAMTTASDGGREQYDPAVAGRPAAAADDPWVDFVYRSVDPVDRLIMEHTLGLGGKPVVDSLTLARRLRLSPSAVSQRKSRIQQKLNERDSLNVL